MEALFFNVCRLQSYFLRMYHLHRSWQVDTGFLEGIVRGYKAGILNQGHYANLTQCDTLEGASLLVVVIGATNY